MRVLCKNKYKAFDVANYYHLIIITIDIIITLIIINNH